MQRSAEALAISTGEAPMWSLPAQKKHDVDTANDIRSRDGRETSYSLLCALLALLHSMHLRNQAQ
jgi:hypothetical protein